MIPPTARRPRFLAGKPRASGDDPVGVVHDRLHHVVNPARAGMILLSVQVGWGWSRKPRASGDDPGPGGHVGLVPLVNPARAGMIPI